MQHNLMISQGCSRTQKQFMFPHQECYKDKDESFLQSQLSDINIYQERNSINLELQNSNQNMKKQMIPLFSCNVNQCVSNQSPKGIKNQSLKIQKDQSSNIGKLILRNKIINRFKNNLLEQSYILQKDLKVKIESVLRLTKVRSEQHQDESDLLPLLTSNSWLIFCWDIANLFLEFVNLWYCAYLATILSFQTQDTILKIILLINIGFEILLNFHRSVLINGEYVRNRWIITKTYLKGGFMWDFLGFLIWLIQILVNGSESYFEILVVFQILLIVIRIIRKYQNSTSQLYLKEYETNFLDLFTLMLILYFFAHIVACLWYYIGEKTSYQGQSWILKYEFRDKSNGEKYNAAFYWATMTMVTVGYGDITATNYYEILFSNFMMLVSSCIFGYSMNSIGMILKAIQDQNCRQRKTLHLVNAYMHSNNVNQSIQYKIRNYFNLQNERESLENAQALENIIEELPSELKLELQLNIQEKIVAKMKVLQRLFSKSTLVATAQVLSKKLMFPGQLIFQQNATQDDSLYYLFQGSIQVIEQKSKKTLSIIKAGDTFGEYSFFSGFQPISAFKALEFCQIYKLERKQFLQIIKRHHRDFEKFHHVKDQINLYKDYSKLNIQCDICKEYSHQEIQCPKLTYQPNLEQRLKKQKFHCENNTRSQSKRTKLKVHTLNVLNTIQQSVKGYLQQEISQILGFSSGNNESPTRIQKVEFQSNTINLTDTEPQPNVVNLKSITMKSQNMDNAISIQGKNLNEYIVETEVNCLIELEKQQLNFSFNIDKMFHFTDYMTHNNIKDVIQKIGRKLTQKEKTISQQQGRYTFYFIVKMKASKLKDSMKNLNQSD